MQNSQEEIVKLYNTFQSLRRYKERIIFYDKHFGILPFDFPLFDERLPILFDEAIVQELIRIREMEKISPLNSKNLNTKLFVFENLSYTFSIQPKTHEAKYYNEFVLFKFITLNFSKSEKLKETFYLFFEKEHLLDSVLQNAIDNLKKVESKLLHKRFDSGIERSFSKVFLQGVIDFKGKSLKISTTRRKFIELYLYAQGILFAQHFQMLEQLSELYKNKQIQ